jgi:hypothetical protein
MYRFTLCAVWFCFAFIANACLAQGPANSSDSNTSCTFADGQQVSLRYTASSKEPNMNGVWSPGGVPMYLFSQTNLTLDNKAIPAGAYSVYLTGKKNSWQVIVNKSVAAGAAYDQKQDIVRAPMEVGKLGGAAAKRMQLSFVHAEPKTCNLRVYYQDSGYWAEFKER